MNLALCYPAYRSHVHTGHLFFLTRLIEASGGGAAFQAAAKDVIASVKSRKATLPEIEKRLTAAYAQQNGIAIMALDSCFLDLSRCRALSGALASNADWALLMDSDTVPMSVGPVADMLNEGQNRGAAVIAAPVELRGQPNGKRCWNAQWHKRLGSVEWEHYLEPEECMGRVVEVDRIGTALMAVNCNWLRKKWTWSKEDPWFSSRFIEHESGQPMKMSEDYMFCDGVKRRGGVVLCDGRVPTMHAEITTETEVSDLHRLSGLEHKDLHWR